MVRFFIGITLILAAVSLFFLLRDRKLDITPATVPAGEEKRETAATTSESIAPPGVKKEQGTTTEKAPKKISRGVIVPPIALPDIPVKPPAATTTASVPKQNVEAREEVPSLPPLDEDSILKSVVKIECPAADGLGKYVGSGFSLGKGIIVTAAHVIKDSGSTICRVIFPSERKPIYYLRGEIENLQEVIQGHDEKGIDAAVIKLPPIDTYPDAKNIFSEYPAIPYPICAEKTMLGDKLLHFGYPSNFVDQNYLSKLEGQAVLHADIDGITSQLSQDQTYTFKTPVFGFTYDERDLHPYMVSRVATFYGDSGGLAFNTAKQCIIGPHRGATIEKASGDHYSIFMNLGWASDTIPGLLSQ